MHRERRQEARVPTNHSARERTGADLVTVLGFQHGVGNRAVARVLARAPKAAEAPAVPWHGVVTATYNAALRVRPEKDEGRPYEGILADIDRGTPVTVVGKEHGWLRVEVVVDGTKRAGYVSHELVEHVATPAPPVTPEAGPTVWHLGVFAPAGAFVALRRAENRRLAVPDWVASADEHRELERAADTLENDGHYLVDRTTFVVTFAPPSTGNKILVTTIEDFILFVEAVEREYGYATPGEVAGEIRQIEYSGGNWEALLESPGIRDAGRPIDLEGPANTIAKQFDIKALKASGHKVTTAFGDVDVFHVVAGIDAALNGAPKAPSEGPGLDLDEGDLKKKTLRAADAGDPRDFATWSGDLGQAYADYLYARYAERKAGVKLLGYIQNVAKPEELLGDIHGYVATEVFRNTPPNAGTGWWSAGQSGTLSNILRTLYLVEKHGTPGAQTNRALTETVSRKQGTAFETFAHERSLAFARVWYVKDTKDGRGKVGAAQHAGSFDRATVVERLMREFDEFHALNEANAAEEDRLAGAVARFLPLLQGSID